MTDMTQAVAAILREPFKPNEIGKLPRIYCGKCRDSRTKNCETHQKIRCGDCRNTITTAHLHLDYVGHAEITDRLLQADPAWGWEPVAFSATGTPLVDEHGGLWIRLTVAGVTRLGYGHADGKKGPDAVKESIGDALRNAAMRFGVALDLWGATFERAVAEADVPSERAEERPAPALKPAPASDEWESSWESARPARAAAAPNTSRAEALAAAIDTAPTAADLKRQYDFIEPARTAGEITDEQARQLIADVRARKEQLEAGQPSTAAPVPAGQGVDQAQHRRMHAQWRELGLDGDFNRDARLARTSEIVGRPIDSSTELSHAEGDLVIDALLDDLKAAKAAKRSTTRQEATR